MKTRQIGIVLTVMVIFILGGLFNVRAETQKADQEGYKKQIEEKLKDFNLKIKELEKKGNAVKEEAKAEYKKELKALKGKEAAAKTKWKELKKAGASKWDEARADMDDAIQVLENSYQKAVSWFKGRNE
jgi:TolA-binding protein